MIYSSRTLAKLPSVGDTNSDAFLAPELLVLTIVVPFFIEPITQLSKQLAEALLRYVLLSIIIFFFFEINSLKNIPAAEV